MIAGAFPSFLEGGPRSGSYFASRRMETTLHPKLTQVSVRVNPMLSFTHPEVCLSAAGSQRQRYWYEQGPNICRKATKEREIVRMTQVSAKRYDESVKGAVPP